MTSFGAQIINIEGFNPTFKIQGQVYHLIGSLYPADNQQHKFLQIYFMGDTELQLEQKCALFQQVHHDIVDRLQAFLYAHNYLIQNFITAIERAPIDKFSIATKAERPPQGAHPRTYNAPEVNEVAVLLDGDIADKRDIIIEERNHRSIRILDCHPSYDALQYPLIFWKGQTGYDYYINMINPANGENLRKTVSCMNYYAYYLMVRSNDFNSLLYYRNLFKQFVVDMYAKIESERLRYIRSHQEQLRQAEYIHLQDAMAQDRNTDPNNLGQRIILPSSFINSPRYLQQYVQDTFAYVREFGKPDYFITLTCNPSWIEITEALFANQSAADRDDIKARVFHLKVKKLIVALVKGKVFGKVIAFVYSIEWQKRGLPHVHLLLWVKDKLRPHEIDTVIKAEIPDPNEDPLLYQLVIKHMVHCPCCAKNPSAKCMKKNKCEKGFPKQFTEHTITDNKGYPLYRRKSPENGGLEVEITVHGKP